MNVKISDLMHKKVVTAAPNDSVADVRALLEKHRIHAVPLVDGDGGLYGIISTVDLVEAVDGTVGVSRFATRRVTTLPQYNDISAAARVMRKRKIHHLVVTHEQEVVGILSSFDLLQLVEDHRFVMKVAPTPKKGRDRPSGP